VDGGGKLCAGPRGGGGAGEGRNEELQNLCPSKRIGEIKKSQNWQDT
jgi:hypothetical protein